MKKNNLPKTSPETAPKTSVEKIEQDLSEETVILVRDNWILKIGSKESFSWIETWIYVQRDATGKYILIDFDSTKVAPIAKGILNELSLFPELKAIRFVWKFVYAILFLSIISLGAIIIFVPSASSIANKINSLNLKPAPVFNTETSWKKTVEEVFRNLENNKRLNQTQTWAANFEK